MFGDIFGNVAKQQEELAAKLAEISVDVESGGGAVKVTASGDGRIKNISLDASQVDINDLEQTEDLLLAAINEALEKAQSQAADETDKLIKKMMPFGGFDQFSGK